MQKRRKMLTWLLTMMMALGLFGAQASIAGFRRKGNGGRELDE